MSLALVELAAVSLALVEFAAVSLALVELAADWFLAARVSRSGAIALSLVVPAAIMLVVA